jgi:hypothetical protein
MTDMARHSRTVSVSLPSCAGRRLGALLSRHPAFGHSHPAGPGFVAETRRAAGQPGFRGFRDHRKRDLRSRSFASGVAGGGSACLVVIAGDQPGNHCIHHMTDVVPLPAQHRERSGEVKHTTSEKQDRDL